MKRVLEKFLNTYVSCMTTELMIVSRKKHNIEGVFFLNLKVEEFLKNKTFKLEPNLECDKFVVWTQRHLTGRDWQIPDLKP